MIALTAAGTGGLQNVNTGAGNDAISAAQAVIAVATINGADVDTLTAGYGYCDHQRQQLRWRERH